MVMRVGFLSFDKKEGENNIAGATGDDYGD